LSAGVKAISIHKRLVLNKRENSDNWYARLSLENGRNIRRSTKTADLELAKEIALSVGQKIANRSIKSNIANSSVKKILHRIIAELNEQANPSHLPIIIC
jgi:hypothetical protein